MVDLALARKHCRCEQLLYLEDVNLIWSLDKDNPIFQFGVSTSLSPAKKPDLDSLISTFKRILQPPLGLHLPDHIVLQLALGQLMLVAGIIQPSNRPYHRPMLLVKKDRSWSFRVNSHELNKLTVIDKVPHSSDLRATC